MPQLLIEGWHGAIPTGRRTLLDAALAAGAPVPYQCRAGECGGCKCRLLRGEVNHAGNLASALSEEERAAGWILSCRSVAQTDVSVVFAEPLRNESPQQQSCRARVSICEPASQEVIRLVVELDRPLVFLAGQYVAVRFPGFPDRFFSPANAPGSKTLEFFVRVLPDGLVSQHIARRISRGDRAKILGPYGQAHLSGQPEGPILAAGGGTGLAPILSILRRLSAQAPSTQVDFYFGVRTAADLFASDSLAALLDRLPGLRIFVVLSDEAPPGYHTGFVAPAIVNNHSDLSRHTVFVAGPPPMVDSVREAVLELGADPQAIYGDPFVANSANGDASEFSFGSWLKFGR